MPSMVWMPHPSWPTNTPTWNLVQKTKWSHLHYQVHPRFWGDYMIFFIICMLSFLKSMENQSFSSFFCTNMTRLANMGYGRSNNTKLNHLLQVFLYLLIHTRCNPLTQILKWSIICQINARLHQGCLATCIPLIVNILAYSTMSYTPLSVHPNSNLITLLYLFFKVLSDPHFSLAEQWPHPYQNNPPMASSPTEPEWHLLLRSVLQQSTLRDQFALHYDFWDDHWFYLFLVSVFHKIWLWQRGPNITWLAQQLHSHSLNVSSSLQHPSP